MMDSPFDFLDKNCGLSDNMPLISLSKTLQLSLVADYG